MDKIKEEFKHNPIAFWSLITLMVLVLLAGFNFRASETTNTEQPPIDTTASPSQTKEEFVQGQVIVKFSEDTPKSAIDQKLVEYNAKIIDSIPQLNYYVLEVPPGKEREVVEKLKWDGFAASADVNYIYEERFTPNDSQFGSQYGLQLIQAPQAWDITRGKGMIIANLEPGGSDIRHPDLAPNVVEGSVYGAVSHGTHTSGIIAAVANNGQGVSGTCPECKLLMLSMQGYNDAGVAKAYVAAADRGAKAISMSFGGPKGGQVLVDAVKYGWDRGLIGVAASGNSNQRTLGGPPGSLDLIVNVASTDKNDKKSSFSNYHPDITIAAPGSNILSTIPGGKYGNNSGTSMAAPMVAGVIGLIYSTSYGTSPQAVVDRLCSTSDKITGTGTQWKCGRVNALKAVQGAAAPTVAPNPSTGSGPTARPPAPLSTAPVVNPTEKPQAIPTEVPRESGAKPTFTAIGDCTVNNNCPPTEEPVFEPTHIAQLPAEQHPANPQPQQPEAPLPAPATSPSTTNSEGLLKLFIELIILIFQILFGRR